MKLQKPYFALLFFFVSTALSAQEGTSADSIYKTTGFYLYTDQDLFVGKHNEDRNYTMGVNLGIFGPVADRNYWGLPWLRKKVDKGFAKKLIHTQFRIGYVLREEEGEGEG